MIVELLKNVKKEEAYMEMVFYKCEVCGFTYQVPEYWSSFSPDEEIEMQHFNLETKEPCSELILKIIK